MNVFSRHTSARNQKCTCNIFVTLSLAHSSSVDAGHPYNTTHIFVVCVYYIWTVCLNLAAIYSFLFTFTVPVVSLLAYCLLCDHICINHSYAAYGRFLNCCCFSQQCVLYNQAHSIFACDSPFGCYKRIIQAFL